MSALPANLAYVGEDLARATQRAAARSLRRRRAAALTLIAAVLVVTTSASVANGWLFGETPTLRAVPGLGDAQAPAAFAAPVAISAAAAVAASQARHAAAHPGDGSTPALGTVIATGARTLLGDLGPTRRQLSLVATSSGGVCLALTDFAIQCVPAFAGDQELSWFIATPSAGPVALYGIARDDVTAVEAVFADDTTASARLGNNAFYLELTSTQPGNLVVQLADGSSRVVAQLPCPPTYLGCSK
jgi:hypothetical protein